jgi:hypothetical protein
MPAGKIFEAVTPWAAADLSRLRYEQQADLAVVSCYGYPPHRVRRFGHNDWRVDPAPIGSQIDAPTITVAVTNPQSSDPDYVAQPYSYAATAVNELGQESQPSAIVTVNNDLGLKGDYNTITISTPSAGAVEYRVYAERSGTYGLLGRIATGTTFKDDNILGDFTTAPPTAFNPFVGDEWPACSAFHEGRLWFGRLPTRPSAVVGSRTDDLFNFDKSSPLQATDSIALAFRGRKVNAIQHLLGFGSLLALTADAIWSISPTADGFLSPLSIKSMTEGFQGVGVARPAPVDDVLFFTTARGNRVRTLGYTFEKDGYKGNNASVFAPHFFDKRTITHMCWAEVPSSVLWCLRDDGKLLALTWQAEQDVWGWTLCETDGIIESIAVVSERTRDALYCQVRRTVNGTPTRMIERMAEPLWINENWNERECAVVMDAAITYTGTPTRVLTRIDHLEGREVAVLADGYVKRGHRIEGGRLTPDLDAPYSRVTVGLPYRALLRTLPVVVSVQGRGSTKGAPEIVKDVVIEVMNTQGILIGYGEERGLDQLYDVEFPNPTGATPAPLFSGIHEVDDFAAGDWTEAKVTIVQDNPLPMVVTGVYPKIAYGG